MLSQKIQTLKPNGSLLVVFTFLLLISSTFALAHPSWGIVVDKERNIYFADILHNERGSVWKLSYDGKLELLFSDFHAHNVSLDKNYNLVTAYGEMDRHTLVRVNQDNSIDTLFHANDYKIFNGGNCTYSYQGRIIFSADHYLWYLTDKGKKVKVSDYYFKWNQTVYVDELGNCYAPDIGDGKGKLIKINTDGKARVIANDLITKPNKPYDKHADVLMGVTKGCDGKIYIAELAGQRIIKIDNDGITETFYKSTGDWFPTGIDFFSGEAYILEYKEKNGLAGPRIIKIDETGDITELFNYDTFQRGSIIQSEKSGNTKNGDWTVLLIGIVLLTLTAQFFSSKIFHK